MSNLPNTKITTIANQISQAFNSVLSKDADRRDARDVFQAASTDATSAREEQLIKVAEIAANEHWSQFETDEGCAKAINSRNDSKDNSIKTFAAEIKRACHPNARQHVKSLADLANKVWDAEISQDKKLPRPCRAAFARKYHLLQRMIGEAVENKHVLTTNHDVVSFAVAHDPAKNPERMFKKFKVLRDSLRELADEYPLDEIVSSVESLREVRLPDFRHPNARQPTPETSAEPAETPKQVSEGNDGEPSEGVSDLLDEALRDIDQA